MTTPKSGFLIEVVEPHFHPSEGRLSVLDSGLNFGFLYPLQLSDMEGGSIFDLLLF